ncbi:uncharacterized protein [Emydura macquarii macquarii]|uniref:uncharacterized protein isoform X1 n=1 Tax=Emydura macquarii macquarii TaxID=1129001 RepID=UPI00352AE118
MARITLEDLGGLDDEPLDEDEEPMDGEEQNRLFSHWETVASTHQVTLPREMVGPIVQMAQHSQVREPVPYVTLLQQEKCEEVAYEERLYPAGKWACITQGEPMYEQSISMGFMKLMRYICKENSTGRYLGMTVPVVNEIHLSEGGAELLRDVTTAYYLPGEFQLNPPLPADPEIRIMERQPLRVIAREKENLGHIYVECIMFQPLQNCLDSLPFSPHLLIWCTLSAALKDAGGAPGSAKVAIHPPGQHWVGVLCAPSTHHSHSARCLLGCLRSSECSRGSLHVVPIWGLDFQPLTSPVSVMSCAVPPE